MTPITYPESARSSQVDEYHGTRIRDPYRWLEDADSHATRAWVARQNELTEGELELLDERGEIGERLERLWNSPKRGLPFLRGPYMFRLKNDGNQNQDALYVSDPDGANERCLLDPNAFSGDGTVSLATFSVSDDGSLLAYGLSDGGSDWITFSVREVASGADRPDRVAWSKFCQPVWMPDGSGFLYQHYDRPDRELSGRTAAPRLRLHRLGTGQEADETIFETPEHPDRMFFPAISDDRKRIVITVARGTEPKHLVYIRNIDDGSLRPLVEHFEAAYHFVGNDGETWYFRTDRNAPRGCVLAAHAPEDGAEVSWREIVPQRDETLLDARLGGVDLLLSYVRDACGVLIRRSLTGNGPHTEGVEESELSLPRMGTVAGISGRRYDPVLHIWYTSFLDPAIYFRYEVGGKRLSEFDRWSADFDPSPFVTELRFAVSADGTRVPLFVVYRKGIALDGRNRTLLWGYGGFNIAIRPFFTIQRAAWLEAGGVLAVACLRGGGEYGSDWHESGTKLRKQNVFDDFIACAELLVDERFTSSRHLAIQGGSNGGLLVGACITQRPDLFAAAHAAVGVMDMVRFHTFTIGWAWESDFGSPDDPEEFKALYAYSPLHNVVDGECYPATILTTGDHDDRVVPGHSFKFAARLQFAQGCDRPVLLRVETRTGHGAGKPKSIAVAEDTDVLSFLLAHTRR